MSAVVTFQFGQLSYTFAELDGTAEVTLVIGGQSAFDIDYTVSTVISATDTAEGMLSWSRNIQAMETYLFRLSPCASNCS